MTTQNSPATPALSVVVIALEGPQALAGCLAALSNQQKAPALEIIVPVDDTLSDEALGDVTSQTVSVVRATGRKTPAELRSLGVGRARGAVVALTEDHCTPAPDWCAEIVRAHAAPHQVIGGALEKAEPDDSVGWALYFADYVRYMNPLIEGPARTLTDCNVSYKRQALADVAEVWRDAFHEPLVHDALRARGATLWLTPHSVVYQRRTLSWRAAMRDRYSFGRLFGATRARHRSSSARVVQAAYCLVLVPILVSLSASHVLRTRRFLTRFLRVAPVLVVLDAAWTWGEFVGSVSGTPAPG